MKNILITGGSEGVGLAVAQLFAAELGTRVTLVPRNEQKLKGAVAALRGQGLNTRNATRGPLLLVSGAADHTVPPVLVRSTLRRYRKSPAVTEMKSFEGRGHSLTIDRGWKELADYALSWLRSKGV
jgi:dienelactone hydrolase